MFGVIVACLWWVERWVGYDCTMGSFDFVMLGFFWFVTGFVCCLDLVLICWLY